MTSNNPTPPIQSAPNTTTTTTAPTPTAEQSAQLDLALTVILFSWPALNLAVQSNWGGPTSAEKRECLCGEISDLLATRPETDAEDLDEILVQFMNDEYDVVVDDGSAAEVAGKIAEARAEVLKGNFDGVKELWEAYQAKAAKGGNPDGVFKKVETTGDDDDDDDDDGSGDGDWEDERDVEMADADIPSTTGGTRQKPELEIDEEGFTKVVGKKKR